MQHLHLSREIWNLTENMPFTHRSREVDESDGSLPLRDSK